MYMRIYIFTDQIYQIRALKENKEPCWIYFIPVLEKIKGNGKIEIIDSVGILILKPMHRYESY